MKEIQFISKFLNIKHSSFKSRHFQKHYSFNNNAFKLYKDSRNFFHSFHPLNIPNKPFSFQYPNNCSKSTQIKTYQNTMYNNNYTNNHHQMKFTFSQLLFQCSTRLFHATNVYRFDKDPWKVLGVPTSANAKQIKDAYIKLAKMYHPDAAQSEETKEKFIEVSKAYEILKNPQQREQYYSDYHGSGSRSSSGRRTQSQTQSQTQRQTQQQPPNQYNNQQYANRNYQQSYNQGYQQQQQKQQQQQQQQQQKQQQKQQEYVTRVYELEEQLQQIIEEELKSIYNVSNTNLNREVYSIKEAVFRRFQTSLAVYAQQQPRANYFHDLNFLSDLREDVKEEILMNSYHGFQNIKYGVNYNNVSPKSKNYYHKDLYEDRNNNFVSKEDFIHTFRTVFLGCLALSVLMNLWLNMF